LKDTVDWENDEYGFAEKTAYKQNRDGSRPNEIKRGKKK